MHLLLCRPLRQAQLLPLNPRGIWGYCHNGALQKLPCVRARITWETQNKLLLLVLGLLLLLSLLGAGGACLPSSGLGCDEVQRILETQRSLV